MALRLLGWQSDASKKLLNVRDGTQMNRVQSFDDVVDDYSVAEVDVRVRSSSKDGDRRFTVTQLTLAVVGTHLITLGICLLVAVVLCLRGRTAADDLERPDDDDLDTRQVRRLHSTGSGYMTGSDVKKMAADMATETVYLRLNGMHHPCRFTGSYLSDTSTTAVSVTRWPLWPWVTSVTLTAPPTMTNDILGLTTLRLPVENRCCFVFRAR